MGETKLLSVGPALEVPPGVHYILWETNLLVPERFSIYVDDPVRAPSEPTCQIDVEIRGGRAECVGLRFERRSSGIPVTGELLRRFPLRRLIRAAIESLAVPLEIGPEGPVATLPMRPIPGTDKAIPATRPEASDGLFQLGDLIAANARLPHRGVPVDDEHLRRVAAVYREALQRGERPTKAVQLACFASRSTAGRWVSEARRRGFLGQAIARRPGEFHDHEET